MGRAREGITLLVTTAEATRSKPPEADSGAYPDPLRRPGPRRGPLSGVRIADFCWMGVGACATRLLGDFGATVIRIENRANLDMPRRLPIYKGEVRTYGDEDANPDPNKGGLFNNYNRNKLGVTLNMRDPRGRELADRLIASSSVLTENFAPGVMERWGLTYERVRELSPAVIYARMSGFGHTGPHAENKSYGPVVQAVSGLSHISGLPGEEPSGWGLSYMDNEAAFFNAAALMMAIYNRNLTGLGSEIDVSAVEAGINLLGPLLLDVSVNGRSTRGPEFPPGNRLEEPHAAPHGVYPCVGEDRWIAIAVFDEVEWRALVAAMGNPAWASEARFATLAARVANQDALDAKMAAWTADKDRFVLMHGLQAVGVRAGAVQTAEDLNETDPQIAERGVYFEMDHPVIGEARFEGTPIQFSSIPQENWRSAPLLAEDNAYVFKTLLGMGDEEFETLTAEGVL
ncbi:MAG: CoA transferase [Caulobacter sp.]|nr:CoA transferase [Caulobacter sp.]